MAQPVSRVALEGHGGANGQVVAEAHAIHRDARIHAGVGVQSHHWRNSYQNY